MAILTNHNPNFAINSLYTDFYNILSEHGLDYVEQFYARDRSKTVVEGVVAGGSAGLGQGLEKGTCKGLEDLGPLNIGNSCFFGKKAGLLFRGQ